MRNQHAPTNRLSRVFHFGCISIGVFWLLSVSGVTAKMVQPETKPLNQRPQSQSQDQDETKQRSDRNQLGDAPKLGVLVTSSPGQGVLVVGTFWGSPAYQEGIRPGDYIMSVNGQAVSKSADLQNMITKLPSDQEAEIEIWRNEKQVTRKIELAQPAEKMPESHQTWLGVVMTPYQRGDLRGVRISRIFPGGPADKSGLQENDVIVKANDQETTSIEDLLVCFEGHGPQTGCQLTVDRNGSRVPLKVSFGDLSEAATEWLQAAFRAPIDEFDLEMGWPFDAKIEGGDVQTLIDDLRQEVQQIRAELNSLNSIERDQNDQKLPNRTQERERDKDSQDSDRDSSNLKQQPLSHSDAFNALTMDNVATSAVSLSGLVTAGSSATPQGSQGRSNWNHQDRFQRENFGNFGRQVWGGQNWNRQPYGYGNFRHGQFYTPFNQHWYYGQGGRNFYNPGYNWGNQFYGPRHGLRTGNQWSTFWY